MKKLIIAAALAPLLFAGCSQIDSDQAGFKTQFGRPDESVLGPGLYGINPIGGSMIKYPVRDMRYDIQTQAFTKDMQEATFAVSVVYAPDRARLIELHTKYGRGYASVLLEPPLASALKDVVGCWEAEQLVNSRDKVASAIAAKLKGLLEGKPVLVKQFNILNIDFSDAFEKSIEEKVVQQQQALKARNKTVQVEEEAKQRLISAKSDAEAISIRAKALSENKDIVWLNAIEKWDGKAPQTLSIGHGGNLFLPAK